MVGDTGFEPVTSSVSSILRPSVDVRGRPPEHEPVPRRPSASLRTCPRCQAVSQAAPTQPPTAVTSKTGNPSRHGVLKHPIGEVRCDRSTSHHSVLPTEGVASHRLALARCDYAGSRIVNRQPPSRLATATVPWWASTRPLTMASPRPAPGRARPGSWRRHPARPRRRPGPGPRRVMPPHPSVTLSSTPSPVAPAGDLDDPVGGGVPDRVHDEVGDHARQCAGSALHEASASTFPPSRTLRARATGSRPGDRLADQVAERDGLQGRG